ncbi:hypothetical protein BN2497_3321 [Janthinobacterium sp. CG23_2]|nr:hypothetical protein BN2497_3321 [Janthinobacterium sp. CG23_2]CUU28058.1 hypothetical protein BN3177_3321 [Janthinobacterium sp. CG23_2]
MADRDFTPRQPFPPAGRTGGNACPPEQAGNASQNLSM